MALRCGLRSLHSHGLCSVPAHLCLLLRAAEGMSNEQQGMSRDPEQRTERLWCRQVSVREETVASTSFTKAMAKNQVHDAE